MAFSNDHGINRFPTRQRGNFTIAIATSRRAKLGIEGHEIKSRRVAHHEKSWNGESQQLAVTVSAEDLAIRDDDMRPNVVAGEAADTSQLAIGFVG